MDVSRNGGDIAFRTAFDERSDLVQVLHGLETIPGRNSPVDFKMAGLQRKGHPDIWHVDQVLAFSTDECSPMVINGEDIGGNHGHPCGVRLTAPDHGKTCRDVGTLWTDEGGMTWTLLRIVDQNRLLMLSENIGEGKYAYDFASAVQGKLRCLDEDAELCIEAQSGGVQLTPAIRHVQREALCLKGGCWQTAGGWHEDVDVAEIREVYEIINPATVAEAIRANRPQGGYTQQPSLAMGESMMTHRMTYRIQADGTILCDFDHELTQPVHMPWYLGIMHQEKCDVFGGGVWRYIPKLLPFTAEGAAYDFSRPYNTTVGPMPRSKSLTRDLWDNPASPPNRQLDFIRRWDGSCGAAFASGFLPVYDGEPTVRAGQISDTGDMVASRKTYPTFAGGKAQIRRPYRGDLTGAMNITSLRGVAYKKYFPCTTANACRYTVEYNGNTYLYTDFFAPEETGLQHPLTTDVAVQLLEEKGVSWHKAADGLTVRGGQGYAAFCLSPANDERG